MSSPSSKTQLDVERPAGRPPMLTVEHGHDPARWAEQHGGALRTAVAEHGAVLVRGLGLRDPDEVADVFRRLVPDGLMPDREAFAARQRYSDGVYSSLKSDRITHSNRRLGFARQGDNQRLELGVRLAAIASAQI
ncbi:MAG: hypothetical protein MOP51_2047 [Citricoccus sp.]|nr:hypothetical protein [Citricoccus sp. WCRC_4]